MVRFYLPPFSEGTPIYRSPLLYQLSYRVVLVILPTLGSWSHCLQTRDGVGGINRTLAFHHARFVGKRVGFKRHDARDAVNA